MYDYDDILDHPYLQEEQEVISLLESIEKEHPKQWIGDKPKISFIIERPDKWLWDRQKTSNDLNIPIKDIPDEPDELPDHSDEQEYDDEEYV